MTKIARRHEILSGSKRGLSEPYGYHWRTWRKARSLGLRDTREDGRDGQLQLQSGLV